MTGLEAFLFFLGGVIIGMCLKSLLAEVAELFEPLVHDDEDASQS